MCLPGSVLCSRTAWHLSSVPYRVACIRALFLPSPSSSTRLLALCAVFTPHRCYLVPRRPCRVTSSVSTRGGDTKVVMLLLIRLLPHPPKVLGSELHRRCMNKLLFPFPFPFNAIISLVHLFFSCWAFILLNILPTFFPLGFRGTLHNASC